MVTLALVGWMLVWGGVEAPVGQKAPGSQPAPAKSARTAKATPDPTPAPQPAFKAPELIRFLADFPKFLEQVRAAKKQELLSGVVRHPETLPEHPEIEAAVKAVGWEPARFLYMLKHVTLGAKALETGGMGDQRLEMLRKKRAEVAASRDIPEDRKRDILADMDESIQLHARDVEESHAIPRSELKLMWSRREDIRFVLHNTFRLRAKKAANPAAGQ
jgi:hypothetical protein